MSAKKKRPDPEEPGLSVSWVKRSLDRFLQFLGGAERNLLGRLDLDRFAGGGVTAHARTALAHHQDAQAVETDARALLQVLGDQTDSVFQDAVGGLLGEFMLFGQLAGKLAGRDSFDFCFRGSCHWVSPSFNESTMSPILRHFSQDKGGAPQKNAINWGFFHIYAKKPTKSGVSWVAAKSKSGQRARAARFTKLLCDSGGLGAGTVGALADARRLAGAAA